MKFHFLLEGRPLGQTDMHPAFGLGLAFFCQTCGRVWGQVTVANPVEWWTVTRHCEAHHQPMLWWEVAGSLWLPERFPLERLPLEMVQREAELRLKQYAGNTALPEH